MLPYISSYKEKQIATLDFHATYYQLWLDEEVIWHQRTAVLQGLKEVALLPCNTFIQGSKYFVTELPLSRLGLLVWGGS